MRVRSSSYRSFSSGTGVEIFLNNKNNSHTRMTYLVEIPLSKILLLNYPRVRYPPDLVLQTSHHYLLHHWLYQTCWWVHLPYPYLPPHFHHSPPHYSQSAQEHLTLTVVDLSFQHHLQSVEIDISWIGHRLHHHFPYACQHHHWEEEMLIVLDDP